MVTMLKPRLSATPARVSNSKARERMRGSAWMKLRDMILRRDPLCVVCKRADRLTPSTEVDHRLPIHRGGSDDDGNLQGLCHACHRLKTAAEADAYAGRD